MPLSNALLKWYGTEAAVASSDASTELPIVRQLRIDEAEANRLGTQSARATELLGRAESLAAAETGALTRATAGRKRPRRMCHREARSDDEKPAPKVSIEASQDSDESSGSDDIEKDSFTRHLTMRASMSSDGTSVACAGTACRSRSVSPRRAVVPRASTSDTAPSLLPWLATVTKDAGLESRVGLANGPHGRCLVALRQLTPDEVIFSVPFSLVFREHERNGKGGWSRKGSHESSIDAQTNDANDLQKNDDENDLSWSASMAMRLLEARAGVDKPSVLLPWIQSLPKFVPTPPLTFTDFDLRKCQDEAAIGEALSVKTAHERAVTILQKRLKNINATPEDLRWATGVLHSRCFVYGDYGEHLAVPGVDMCNHALENPTAYVRIVSSPETCQGSVATREIAEVTNESDATTSEQFFQLRASDAGVEAGDEVCISYGDWPNDPFFLYFGFVPDQNPNDAVFLFENVADIKRVGEALGVLGKDSLDEALGEMDISDDVYDDVSGTTDENVRSTQSKRNLYRLTRSGIDQSILDACQQLGINDWRPVVEHRCLHMLRAFPTTLKEDRQMLNSDDEKLSDDNRTAVSYRVSKKEVLLGPVAQLRQREARQRAASEAE